MILHKLLFFKLPYRYAAVGDANGEPISRDEEGEKMEKLEKEVLAYPGYGLFFVRVLFGVTNTPPLNQLQIHTDVGC